MDKIDILGENNLMDKIGILYLTVIAVMIIGLFVSVTMLVMSNSETVDSTIDSTINDTLETVCYPALKYCVTTEGKIPMEEIIVETMVDEMKKKENCLAVYLGTIVTICD